MPRIISAASLLALLVSVNAVAHTRLSKSVPSDGAEVTAPAEITLEFSESVHVTAVALMSGDTRHELGDLPANALSSFTLPVAGSLAAGEYEVTWRAVSADTHIITGAFSFIVAAPSAAVSAPAGDDHTESDTAGAHDDTTSESHSIKH